MTGLLTPGTDVVLLLELPAFCFYYKCPKLRIFFLKEYRLQSNRVGHLLS